MASMKAILLAGAFVAGAVNFAAAADLLPPLPSAPEVPAPSASGFYLRGDLGAGINMLSDQYSSFAAGVPGGFANDGAGAGVQGLVDFGAGYQFNNWFRFDVTGEYRWPTRYWGLESYTAACGAPGGTCYDRYSANISSAVLLANGYFDLGTWYGITPFVGAGVGGAYNMFNDLTDTALDTTGYGAAADHGQFGFAWALMAGVSYSITSNLKLEFSYRYLNLGTFASSPIICNCGGADYESERFRLASNDIRIGLRYTFAEVPAAAPPLVTKY